MFLLFLLNLYQRKKARIAEAEAGNENGTSVPGSRRPGEQTDAGLRSKAAMPFPNSSTTTGRLRKNVRSDTAAEVSGVEFQDACDTYLAFLSRARKSWQPYTQKYCNPKLHVVNSFIPRDPGRVINIIRQTMLTPSWFIMDRLCLKHPSSQESSFTQIGMMRPRHENTRRNPSTSG